LANLICYKQQGFKPDQDLIVALETDEEISEANAMGIQWCSRNHRELIERCGCDDPRTRPIRPGRLAGALAAVRPLEHGGRQRDR
jgi:hypothetical protein